MILVQINQKHQYYILKVQYVVKSVWVMRWWERTSSPDTEGSRSIKRAVKDAFHLPHRKLDSRVTDGDSSIWQTYWRAEQRPGTGSGAGILGESGWHQEQACLHSGREISHTLSVPQSCWGANGGWQGAPLLKSCRCLEMAFMWMGALTGVVWRLSLHTEHPVILFCWFLINKQRLKATIHLARQHSDFLVAMILFVFESWSNSHWGDHIHWEVLTFSPT